MLPSNAKMPKEERKTMKDWLKSKGLKQKDLYFLPDDGEETRNDIIVKLTDICQKLPKKI